MWNLKRQSSFKIFLNILIYCHIGLLVLTCNPKIHTYEHEVPKQPTGLKVRANSGLSFTLYYFVQNKESSFDGYNVYITRESTGNISPGGSYAPYSLNGGYPTLVHNSKDVNVDQTRTCTLTDFVTYNSNSIGSKNTLYFPFEKGVRYFFKITAHTNFDVESTPSNEVSAVAIP